MSLFLLALAFSLVAANATAQQNVPGAHFIENWDLDEDGQVTLSEAQEKRSDIFAMFDQDEDGVLSAAEYDLFDETRMADMNENAGGHAKGPMKAANQGMMRDFNDTDGDGQVSRAEFDTRSADWFKMVDRSGDGMITTEDFGPPKN